MAPRNTLAWVSDMEFDLAFHSMTRQAQARSAKIWLIVNPHTTNLIRDLAQGAVPLDYTTFTEHSHRAKVAFLREFCIEHGFLAPVHLDSERFQNWLDCKLQESNLDDAHLLKQYARWVHLNRLHNLAATGQIRRAPSCPQNNRPLSRSSSTSTSENTSTFSVIM